MGIRRTGRVSFLRILGLLSVVGALMPVGVAGAETGWARNGPITPLLCPVSRPVTQVPSDLPGGPDSRYFGSGGLWTSLWDNGRVVFEPTGAGFVLEDGSLGMKWPWIPLEMGELNVVGRRLDGAASPLRADIEGTAFLAAGGLEFYPTYLIFPTPGCWEVTGSVGDDSVTFVTLVVRIGDGPQWRPEG